MKIMVCSNVEGLSEERINSVRQKIEDEIRLKLHSEENLIVIFDTIPNARGPLNALGRSLEKMADADAIYFADGYTKCRNGMVEYLAARLYNKNIIRE